jgi:hypothetical protein
MTEPSLPFTLNSNSTGIVLLSGVCGFPCLEKESTVGANTMYARVNNVIANSQDLRISTNNLIAQTDELTAQTGELRTRTDELKERTDKISKQIDDLMLTREFTINLSECFLEYHQFISPKTGDVKHEYRLPIRAYCPSIYWGRGQKDNKFLREIHIKIQDMCFCEYKSEYDLDAANDVLRVIINGYKKEKRIRIIAKDDCDGNDYIGISNYGFLKIKNVLT